MSSGAGATPRAKTGRLQSPVTVPRVRKKINGLIELYINNTKALHRVTLKTASKRKDGLK